MTGALASGGAIGPMSASSGSSSASGALAGIGAPAGAWPYGGRMTTPGVTTQWLLVGVLSLRAAAAGAGFTAATGAAFAAGKEMRMRRAWLGSMPKAVLATTRAINTRNFIFTMPPSAMAAWRRL